MGTILDTVGGSFSPDGDYTRYSRRKILYSPISSGEGGRGEEGGEEGGREGGRMGGEGGRRGRGRTRWMRMQIFE